jgi:hypothetical protein
MTTTIYFLFEGFGTQKSTTTFAKLMVFAVAVLAMQGCMSRILPATETEKTKEGELEEEKVKVESKPVLWALDRKNCNFY